MADKKHLLYLFYHPTEPLIMPKGDDNVSFELPPEYLPIKYRSMKKNFKTASTDAKPFPIKKLTSLPDLEPLLKLPRNAPFSIFNQFHSEMASYLIDMLTRAETVGDLISLAAYCRDHINPSMFAYALSVVILHRPDTRDLTLPAHVEIFPSSYIEAKVLGEARTVTENNCDNPIEIKLQHTSNNLDPEHKVSYFREDLGINSHHWHWHLVYPFNAPFDIVNKNRRGELFYYMHQQIIARYNMERLCNNMNRVVRLMDWRSPVKEGYFPKLHNSISSRDWPSRAPNSYFSNIRRIEGQHIQVVDIENLERWRDRIFVAIHSGFVINPQGEKIKLTEQEGIDVLGNLVESSILSKNHSFYGDLHNKGHIVIGFVHDPDSRYMEQAGVMSETSTAMRDPIFYRWHAYLDFVFQEFKSTLPSYKVENLTFDDVKVTSVEVTADGVPKNEFATFWQQTKVDIKNGLDFVPLESTSVWVQFTHLQHTPFSYKIAVENNGNERTGTVRIFMAPKFDECGSLMLFREQKQLFVELDKFSVSLKNGMNEITRRSSESSVTIPDEFTYRSMSNEIPVERAVFDFCGCGWPNNMLIAKGSAAGFQCQLFVMVSNGADDQVKNTSKCVQGEKCKDSSSYCGLRDSLYPDARSMGYPFDRKPRDELMTLQEFLTPNMTVQDVVIRFADRTEPPKKCANEK